MDITITLYSTSDEPNKVEKSLSETKLEIVGKLKEEQDITAPAITISITSNDVFNYNYAYISEPFKRYYFVTGFDTGLNNLVTIYFKEDVLMSWKENIYNLTPLVVRQATEYNPMLIDGNIPIKTNPDITLSNWILKYPNFNGIYVEYSSDINFNDSNLLNYTYCMAFKTISHIIYSDDSEPDYIRSSCVPTSTTYITTFKSLTSNMEKWIDPPFWQSVANWFLETSELVSNVIFYPFDILRCTSIYTDTDTISFMPGAGLSVDNCKRLFCESVSLCGCEIGFKIRHYHNFIDYLCVYKLNLPFLGEIVLDTELLLNLVKEDNIILYVNLLFDSGDGTAKYVITYAKIQTFNNGETINYILPSHIVFMSDNFQLGYNIPLTSSNGASRKLNALISGIKVAGSIATMGAGYALQGASFFSSPSTLKLNKKTKDKRLKVGSDKYNERMSNYKKSLKSDVLSDQIPALSNTLSSVANVMHLDVVKNQGQSGELFPYINLYVELICSKPVPEIPNNYYELYGGVCNLTVPLSTLKDKGFTICANLHMTGFPNCTLEEVEEIEELLLSGVIL